MSVNGEEVPHHEAALMSGGKTFMGITLDVLNGGLSDSEDDEEELTPKGYSNNNNKCTMMSKNSTAHL